MSHRGLLMGNRGIIHDDQKNIITTHALQGWVSCLLEFKGLQRTVLSPGSYTELFFLDEATAFSAGHRPCGYCQRQRYTAFKQALIEANADIAQLDSHAITQIDRIIHRQRIHRGKKVTFCDNLDRLPHGTMIAVEDVAYLVWTDGLYAWSFAGYKKVAGLGAAAVTVLTPKAYVNAFRYGFRPRVHDSIDAESACIGF